MKHSILTIIILFIGVIAYPGNGNTDKEKNNTQFISGKIIDKISGEEIAGAEIKLGDKIIYSDLNGDFTTNITTNKPELTVSSVSYKEETVVIDSYSYRTLIIELASQ